MDKMLVIAVAVATTLNAAHCHADTKTTYRDPTGRVQGTVTVDSRGKTTWRDSIGRVQGTATTDSRGKTTYRDAMGRVQGTKTTR